MCSLTFTVYFYLFSCTGGDLVDETLATKGIFKSSPDGSFVPLFDKAQKAIILAAKNGYPEVMMIGTDVERVERERVEIRAYIGVYAVYIISIS